MQERAIKSIVFGLVFGVLITAVTFAFPTVTKYQCAGKSDYLNAHYDVVGPIEFDLGENCVGGSTVVQKGFPLASREKVTPPTINPKYLTEAQKNPEFKVNASNVIGNYIFYVVIGFLLFFIFSPSKKTIEMRKFSKSH